MLFILDVKRKPKKNPKKGKKSKKNKKTEEESASFEYMYKDRPYYPEEGLDLFQIPKLVKLLFSPLKLLGVAKII